MLLPKDGLTVFTKEKVKAVSSYGTKIQITGKKIQKFVNKPEAEVFEC